MKRRMRRKVKAVSFSRGYQVYSYSSDCGCVFFADPSTCETTTFNFPTRIKVHTSRLPSITSLAYRFLYV